MNRKFGERSHLHIWRMSGLLFLYIQDDQGKMVENASIDIGIIYICGSMHSCVCKA